MNDEAISYWRDVRKLSVELCDWIEIASRAAKSESYDSEYVCEMIQTGVSAVMESLIHAESYGSSAGCANQGLAIRGCLRELHALGFGKSARHKPLSTSAQADEILRAIPSHVLRNLRDAIRQVTEFETEFLSAQKAREDIVRAIQSGVLVEYVQRNPGKGCLRAFPTFEENARYSMFEGKESWTECIVYVYTDELWVIGETMHHYDAYISFSTSFSLIQPGEAARRMLADTECALGIEDIELLSSLRDSVIRERKPTPRIAWNSEQGKLTIDGETARMVARPKQAKNITRVLDVFEEEGWPPRVDSPFPNDEEGAAKLRETIRELNKNATGIRFEADGQKEGVKYRLVHETPSPTELAEQEGMPF